MRRWFVVVAGLAGLLGVIGGTVLANTRPSLIASPQTFTLVGSTSHASVIVDATDGKPLRKDPGDVLLLVSKLTDENDANVGKARIQCTLHVRLWEICTYVWDIADRGRIVAEGTMPPYAFLDTPPFDLAVTGGTGEFSNVRGSVHIEVLDGGERDTFDLIP